MDKVNWILIADRSRALILHALPNGARPFPVLYSFDHPESRLTGCEVNSDASGRIQLPGVARTTVEPHEDRKHVESRRFARQIVDALEHGRQEGRFDRLFVIAPPMFLGVLRESWPSPLRHHIAAEVIKDLMQLPEAERQQRVEEILSSSE